MFSRDSVVVAVRTSLGGWVIRRCVSDCRGGEGRRGSGVKEGGCMGELR